MLIWFWVFLHFDSLHSSFMCYCSVMFNIIWNSWRTAHKYPAASQWNTQSAGQWNTQSAGQGNTQQSANKIPSSQPMKYSFSVDKMSFWVQTAHFSNVLTLLHVQRLHFYLLTVCKNFTCTYMQDIICNCLSMNLGKNLGNVVLRLRDHFLLNLISHSRKPNVKCVNLPTKWWREKKRGLKFRRWKKLKTVSLEVNSNVF